MSSDRETPTVLREDKTHLVLNKPSGWHSVIGKSDAPTVETWLKKNFSWSAALPEGGLVHRLDQWTSGCMVVAKNLEAYKDLQHRFRKGIGIKKVYWALTKQSKGARPPHKFEFYFSSRYKSSKKVSVKDTGNKKHLGICEIHLLMKSRDHYLFEVDLIGSGQRHQIRAGMAHLGFPILGDTTYGGPERHDFFGLHAFRISLGAQKIQAPPPDSWAIEIPLEKLDYNARSS
jgi:23S rRNA pseudouridine1911/1915/1917 synthase